jgi:hypothetical protein
MQMPFFETFRDALTPWRMNWHWIGTRPARPGRQQFGDWLCHGARCQARHRCADLDLTRSHGPLQPYRQLVRLKNDKRAISPPHPCAQRDFLSNPKPAVQQEAA